MVLAAAAMDSVDGTRREEAWQASIILSAGGVAFGLKLDDSCMQLACRIKGNQEIDSGSHAAQPSFPKLPAERHPVDHVSLKFFQEFQTQPG